SCFCCVVHLTYASVDRTMRRPRAFTCSKLKAEPLPPPTRKPLGYALTSATTSVQASSSPCKCGKCGESPAAASSSSPASSSSSQSPSSSRVREATSAGGQGSRTPPLAEALGPSNIGSPATAGRPRFRRLPRNAHLPRRSVFNNPPPLPAPPSTSLLAAAGGELEEQGGERAGGLAPPPPPSDQRKRGSDRGEPRGSFAAPTAGKQLAASAAASTPTKSAAAGLRRMQGARHRCQRRFLDGLVFIQSSLRPTPPARGRLTKQASTANGEEIPGAFLARSARPREETGNVGYTVAGKSIDWIYLKKENDRAATRDEDSPVFCSTTGW
ncbi:unnamed protein product, partial [Ectocarpus sp. 6 AP-2014]